MATNAIALYQGFASMKEAIDQIETAMRAQFQPMRRETKELVKNFNKKCRKVERQITDLPEDAQYSQR